MEHLLLLSISLTTIFSSSHSLLDSLFLNSTQKNLFVWLPKKPRASKRGEGGGQEEAREPESRRMGQLSIAVLASFATLLRKSPGLMSRLTAAHELFSHDKRLV
jgi:hypothetical protein